MADEIVDETVVDVVTPEAKPVVNDAMKDLLEDQGFDSIEELREAIKDANSIKSELGDADLKELKERNKTLSDYEKFWEREEAAKLKEKEDPEDTIARLENEIKERDGKETAKQQAAREQAEAKKAIAEFESTVSSVLDKEATGLSKAERGFLDQFVGINNEANSIDINSKAEVRKMAAKQVKAYLQLRQDIIKNYRDGKLDTPQITPAEPVAGGEEIKPKTIAESGKIARERATASSK